LFISTVNLFADRISKWLKSKLLF